MSVAPSSFATSLDRRIQMLRTAMGPLIAAALEDPDVVEVMLNPDRTLWVDRLSSGRAPMGVELSEADGERIIRLVAAHVGAEVHRGQPLLSAELPETGERFEGILPPAAPGPAFALRKRAIGVIPLERYVIDGMMTSAQAGFLVRVVRERQNVLIAGATSSGKTTLANALLAEIAATGDRHRISAGRGSARTTRYGRCCSHRRCSGVVARLSRAGTGADSVRRRLHQSLHWLRRARVRRWQCPVAH